MPAKQTYEYAVIRFVPRVEREEFLNLGVILFSKQLRYLDLKFRIDEGRIRAFSPASDIQEIRRYLRSWSLICAGDPQGGRIALLDQPERFRWLAAARSTIIQCGPTHSGLCGEGDTTLEELFEKYLGEIDAGH